MDSYIERLHNKQLKPYVIDNTGHFALDHADALKTADYYIGSWLRALQPISVYSTAGGGGRLIKTFKKGDLVGRIFSYIVRNGKVYWELEDLNNGPGGGFVEHAPGKFDLSEATETSSGKEIEKKVEEFAKTAAKLDAMNPIGKLTEATTGIIAGVSDVVSGAGKTLSSIGSNLKWYIAAILVIVIIVGFIKLKG